MLKKNNLKKLTIKKKIKLLKYIICYYINKKNTECARCLSSFSSDEILRIMGHHSKEIEKILGYVAKSEVIHKDDMVEV
jgi:glutamate 5-kinase